MERIKGMVEQRKSDTIKTPTEFGFFNDWHDIEDFYWDWEASDRTLTYEAWLNSPKRWWRDVWTYNLLRMYHEKKKGTPKANVPTFKFEELDG